MSDELRVTVVATGLGVPAKEEKPAGKTKVVVDNTRRKNTGEVDYSSYERPTVMRQNAQATGQATATAPATEKELEYLDIPAFLRRQAD